MNRKILAFVLLASMALAVTGCSGKTADQTAKETQAPTESLTEEIQEEESTEVLTEAAEDISEPAEETAEAEETAGPAEETATMPEGSDMVSDIDDISGIIIPLPCMYTGDDPYMPAVFRWMEESLAIYYEDGDFYIPAPVIFYTDDSNEEDIRIWGNFWVFRYGLEDENLMCESGGAHPGLLHLKKSEDENVGYEVFDFEACTDGAGFDEDLRKICDKAPEEAGDLYKEFCSAADNGTNDAVRKEYIQMYADQVPFKISSYQDFGWEPVMLDD